MLMGYLKARQGQREMHAGVQIAKLSPFRSYVVILMMALSLTIMAILQFRGGTAVYVIVSLTHHPQPCLLSGSPGLGANLS